MTTTAKKTTSGKQPAIDPVPEKPARPGGTKKFHALYQETADGLGDVRIYGDRTRAWEALATTHTGADGWKYVTAEIGASLRDAIAEAAR